MPPITWGIRPHLAFVVTAWEADSKSIAPPRAKQDQSIERVEDFLIQDRRGHEVTQVLELDALLIEDRVHTLVGGRQSLAVDVQRLVGKSGRAQDDQASWSRSPCSACGPGTRSAVRRSSAGTPTCCASWTPTSSTPPNSPSSSWPSSGSHIENLFQSSINREIDAMSQQGTWTDRSLRGDSCISAHPS